MPIPIIVPKILAPAGGRAQFFAALNSGADGVYLGLKSFSARATAENFSLKELGELLPLAHKYNFEVLVAINTLLGQNEIKTLPPVLAELAAICVSGIIVQDLGVAALIRTHFPTIPLHASTQMAIHNVHGVRAAKELGFKRVVLARELTLTEIQNIRQEFPSHEMELEIFCHGSLCYAYSGLCFLGGLQEGRSGNRGQCPYPCRASYEHNQFSNHPMSMRDLNTLPILEKLVEAGPDVLKIEGRKKDAQYVTAVVQSYRARLNAIFGKNTLREKAPHTQIPPEQTLAQELACSFQRSSTTLFLEGDSAQQASTLDPSVTTHLGLPIGVVKYIDPCGITFQTQSDLALHDGLAVESQKDPIAFGLTRMFVSGKSVTETKAYSTVTIFAPEKNLAVGARVFKTRSDSLRARTDSLSRPPAGEKLHTQKPIELNLLLEYPFAKAPHQACLTITASTHGNQIFEKSFFPNAAPPQNSTHNAAWNEKLEKALTQSFEVLGELGLRAQLRIVLPATPVFIPPSALKQIKRELTAPLSEALQNHLTHLSERAIAWLDACPLVNSRSPAEHNQSIPSNGAHQTLHIKTDSLEITSQFPPTAVTFSLNSQNIHSTQTYKTLSLDTRIALPLITREKEQAELRSALQKMLDRGHTRFEVGGLGPLFILKECAGEKFSSLDIFADYTFYTENRAAIWHLQRLGIKGITLNPEATSANLSTRFFENTMPCTLVLYANVALMHSENCVRRSLLGKCMGSQCSFEPEPFTDKNKRTFLAYRDGCRSVITAEKPYSSALDFSVPKELLTQQFRLDFLWKSYSISEALTIFQNFHRKIFPV
jgi:putative protease